MNISKSTNKQNKVSFDNSPYCQILMKEGGREESRKETASQAPQQHTYELQRVSRRGTQFYSPHNRAFHYRQNRIIAIHPHNCKNETPARTQE